jgi:hypothetical protein
MRSTIIRRRLSIDNGTARTQISERTSRLSVISCVYEYGDVVAVRYELVLVIRYSSLLTNNHKHKHFVSITANNGIQITIYEI